MSKGIVLCLVMLKAMYRQGICRKLIIIPCDYAYFRSLRISLFKIELNLLAAIIPPIFLNESRGLCKKDVIFHNKQ